MSTDVISKLPDQSVGDMAESIGGVIGDLLPDGCGFVLLIFRPGDREGFDGMAHATNTEPDLALAVLNQFRLHAQKSLEQAMREKAKGK
jgi:hypothetical protein